MIMLGIWKNENSKLPLKQTQFVELAFFENIEKIIQKNKHNELEMKFHVEKDKMR